MHIYRLVSEATIEENILAKSDQKRQLDHLAIQSGGFNTEFLSKISPVDILGGAPGGEAAIRFLWTSKPWYTRFKRGEYE